MIKRIMCIVLLCLLILGCKPENGEQSIEAENIYSGTAGLKTEIVDKSFPSEIYENENFDFVVRVTNKGPIEINNARLLVVPERGYLAFSDGSPTKPAEILNLEGKEQFQTVDDFEILTFGLRAMELESLSEIHNAIVSVSTCYDYISKAWGSVCIDTDPHNIKPGDKACTVKTLSLSGGQGGPLVINRVEPRMTVDGENIRPQFKIYVENVGQGSVTRYGNVERYCSNQPLDQEDYNVIPSSQIEIGLPGYGTGSFSCVPQELALKGKQDYITCTLRDSVPPSIDPYMTTISVELRYGYVDSQARQITINKLT